MKRYLLFLLSFSAMAATVFSADAKSILIINSQIGEPYESTQKSMLEELRALGYDEAKGTLKVKTYSMGNNLDFIKRIMGEEGDAIDTYNVIVLNGTTAVNGAKSLWLGDAKKKFLFANITDPVGAGVIDDFVNPPKSNFSGICYPVPLIERLRFLRKIVPSAKRIGYIYGDMAQSISYLKWLNEALADKEFKDYVLVTRKIDLVLGENGTMRMSALAKTEAQLMDKSVDVFLTPNDQMGTSPDFAKGLAEVISKPLIGLGNLDVLEHRGAVASIYPSTVGAGKRIARMVRDVIEGKPIKGIIPEWPGYDVVLDKALMERLKLTVPAEFKDKLK